MDFSNFGKAFNVMVEMQKKEKKNPVPGDKSGAF